MKASSIPRSVFGLIQLCLAVFLSGVIVAGTQAAPEKTFPGLGEPGKAVFPRLAKMADKFALCRGVIGSVNEHSTSTTQTGYGQKEMKDIGGPPAIGSVISKLQGFNNGVAPFVSTFGVKPGYVGPQYKSFDTNSVKKMLQVGRISGARLSKRASLLQSIDNLRREADASGQFAAADAFSLQAVDVVLSGRMADALDDSKIDPKEVERYEGHDRKMRNNRTFLSARRLVEAGVRCVSVSWGGWDTHSGNFTKFRQQLPMLDSGLSNLIQDLHDRGMQDDVIIAVWGEFGRTPRVNSKAGRDHWSHVAATFLAGGCVQGGRVVGASDHIASDAETPVHIHEIISTLYHNMGIDVKVPQLIDPAGRPRFLVDHRQPIRGLL
jgi:hypothetical protein